MSLGIGTSAPVRRLVAVVEFGQRRNFSSAFASGRVPPRCLGPRARRTSYLSYETPQRQIYLSLRLVHRCLWQSCRASESMGGSPRLFLAHLWPSLLLLHRCRRLPRRRSDVNLKAVSTPAISIIATSEQRHDQISTTVLSSKAPAFSLGRPFGTPPSTTSTSTTLTQPILPPIKMSPHTSVSGLGRP